MTTMLQFFAYEGVKKHSIIMKQDDTIDELFRKVCAAVGSGRTPENINLIFAGSSLVYGENKKLSDYGIANGSRIEITVRLEGGNLIRHLKKAQIH